MRKRAAAIFAASIFTGGALAATASAAGPPPPTSPSGHAVRTVASGLMTPTSFAWGHKTMFEGDGGNSQTSIPNGGIYQIKRGHARKLKHSPVFVAGLAFHKNVLYISAITTSKTGPKFQILRWRGWNGRNFTKRRAIFTGPAGFDGFNGIAFGPDGRLYVGVDVGYTDNNDHGAASTSPFLYDILSMNTGGKKVKIFATGMRQPWQMVFPTGSSSPLVSDLGPDNGNPPDLLLKVSAGNNFGFPKCDWSPTGSTKHPKTSPLCKGFTKPFKLFAPHTDIMGLGIIGKTLYMTSFQGPGGTGPGGDVFSMPVNGSGTVSTVLTGFVAPTVGLGVHRGWVYVGELTGQIFRVKA